MHIIGQIGLYLTNNLRSARLRAPIHVGPLHDTHSGQRNMAYWMSRPAHSA